MESSQSYWWQIPIDKNVGLLANNQLRDSPWAGNSGAEPVSAARPIRLADGGLFPILSGSRNQGTPFQTNGGLFGLLGWPVSDAPHDAWTSTRDDTAWVPPIPSPVFRGPNGPGDASPPNWPQTAMPPGANVGSLARAGQPSDRRWESTLAPLVQAQFPFESGSEPVPTARKRVDAAECNAMHERDLFHCRMVGLPACYAQGNLRLANCLDGKQLPPLSY
jgi:hypothetical protein